MINKICIIIIAFFFVNLISIKSSTAEENSAEEKLIFKLDIKEDIMPVTWRKVEKAFDQATEIGSDLIIIHMNTYGGMVDVADSIRTIILNSRIPVYVFIDNNAASAGALISIACDRIYMRKGANIGAATVVTQTGEQAPDKYQAYMRSTMRSTAEAQGKDTIIIGQDTTYKWKRDPLIAEAMVDADCYIKDVIDSGKVVTFTTTEAIKYGFCDLETESITEILSSEGIEDYEIYQYKISPLDSVIGFMMNPILQGILIMIIVAGIYFELQTSGVGFPILASGIAAVLYFAPLYLEGFAEYWEIILFIVGIVLLAVEIFAIPGFGVAGISGIVLIITGLTLSMINNIALDFEGVNIDSAFRSLSIVMVSTVSSFILSIWLGKKLLTDSKLNFLVLNATQQKSEGFIGVDSAQNELIGNSAIAATVLRPSGKIIVNDEMYDATAIQGYIEKGEELVIIKYETGQLYVRKK